MGQKWCLFFYIHSPSHNNEKVVKFDNSTLNTQVQAARILLRSIMNWLSNNVEFMKFILEMVVREALQMSC